MVTRRVRFFRFQTRRSGTVWAAPIVLAGLVALGSWGAYPDSSLAGDTSVTQQAAGGSARTTLLAPVDFRAALAEPGVFVVDVHIPEQQHIAETDAVIPFNDIESNLNRLPADKSTPIAVYCLSGGMSARAAAQLVRLGYERVIDLAGGTIAWSAAGLPFIDDKTAAGRHVPPGSQVSGG